MFVFLMFRIPKTIKFLIFFYLFFNVFSSISQTNEDVPLNNIVQYESPKPVSSLIFEDFLGNEVNLNNYHGKLVIINFWATWCAPCKDEMPSLNNLNKKKNLENLKIFPINVGQDNFEKSLNFFESLNINNLKVYFDTPVTLAKKLQLRGIPTSILINKDGFEFARIVGSIDFENENFVKWLSNYN